MNEHLDRIDALQRSVRRWRLATFVLALLLVCSIAVGGTMNLLLMLELPQREEIMMERERAEADRHTAEQALQEARAAREQERQARQRAEQALRELEGR
jgi:hypothetical protein